MTQVWRPWTVAEMDAFMALLATGRSFCDVAAVFGRSPEAARKHLIQEGYIKTVQSRIGRLRAVVACEPWALPTRPDEPPPNRRDDGCQWIHGATGRVFCGSPRVSGSSWCDHHRQRCFTKANGHG
jgi:hypothetical protein